MRIKQSGITLLELMVVVAIVAIIAAVAYPSFTDGLRKSRRAEAMKGLLSMQLKQEEYRIANLQYVNPTVFNATPALLGSPTSDYYTFTISGASATAYTLVATTKGAQVGDKAGNTACDTLTINKADIKTPVECW
ncbi:type IV pilin protein [Aeromonas sp. 164P]